MFKDFVIHIYEIRHLYVQLRAELYQLENCLVYRVTSLYAASHT